MQYSCVNQWINSSGFAWHQEKYFVWYNFKFRALISSKNRLFGPKMCQVVKLIRNRKSRKRYILYAKSCTSSLYVCSLRALHSRKRFACFKLLQGTPLSLGQQEELLTWVETNFYYFAHIVRRHHQHHEALTNTSSASVRTARWLHTLMQISFTQQATKQ